MNIRNRDIMNCLPLLASVLGSKYGVKIVIGSDKACTDGNTIYLPSLPDNLDEKALAMTKGYVDHESAHIRHTDFSIFQHSRLDKTTAWIFNAIEDWRVEKRLAEVFPGCGDNFKFLIREIFLNGEDAKAGNENPAFAILRYILLTLRSWEVLELAQKLKKLVLKIEKPFPGLTNQLDKIMDKIHADCPDTTSAIAYARELSDCIRNWAGNIQPETDDQKVVNQEIHQNKEEIQAHKNADDPENAGSDEGDEDKPYDGNESTPQDMSGHKSDHAEATLSDDERNLETVEKGLSGIDDNENCIKNLYEDNGATHPENFGEILEAHIDGIKSSEREHGVKVAIIGDLKPDPLNEEEKRLALRSCGAMRARLSGLLQAKCGKLQGSSTRGKLVPARLHRIVMGNGRVFSRKEEGISISTAIHILLDVSFSMEGQAILLARQACYAVAKTLEGISGVNPAITVFPANTCEASVYPVVKHGSRISDRFGMTASGDTPLGPALWWVIGNMLPLKENRKIILVITDGVPNSVPAAKSAINKARELGFEVYGIGVMSSSLSYLLQENSHTIWDLPELAPAMFKLLQQTLINGGGNDKTN